MLCIPRYYQVLRATRKQLALLLGYRPTSALVSIQNPILIRDHIQFGRLELEPDIECTLPLKEFIAALPGVLATCLQTCLHFSQNPQTRA